MPRGEQKRMGFGSTAKKVQKLANLAEKTYKRLNELREQVQEVRTTVDETGERVERLESELTEQRAVLDAVARELDVDADGIVDELDVEDVDAEDVAAGGTDADDVDPAATPDDAATASED